MQRCERGGLAAADTHTYTDTHTQTYIRQAVRREVFLHCVVRGKVFTSPTVDKIDIDTLLVQRDKKARVSHVPMETGF